MSVILLIPTLTKFYLLFLLLHHRVIIDPYCTLTKYTTGPITMVAQITLTNHPTRIPPGGSSSSSRLMAGLTRPDYALNDRVGAKKVYSAVVFLIG